MPACSSAAWRRAAISAGWPAPPSEVALVLDAAGKDVVMIETVGVGQDEVDIVRTADVSIVTIVPGRGDEVQALKAGIMEIADIFVVNKADREGADRTVASIEALLSLQTFAAGEWRPPIVKTEATTGDGRRRSWSRRSTGFARTRPATQRRAPPGARRVAPARAARRSASCSTSSGACSRAGEFDAMLDRIAARELDPYTAADEIAGRALGRCHGRARHESATRSRRHRGRRPGRRRWRSIATRWGWRSSRRRRCRRSACARTSSRPAGRARAARGDRRRLADREVVAKRGPGLHHITLRVDDIWRRARAARSRAACG